MKALSLLQPWASLWAMHKKKWETRSRLTHIRGVIAIHASAKFHRLDKLLCRTTPFGKYVPDPEKLPLGAIIAVTNITDCITSHEAKDRLMKAYKTDPSAYDELAFGNYEPGRFIYISEGTVMLPEPIPCNGAQGWWNVPDNIEEQIKATIKY